MRSNLHLTKWRIEDAPPGQMPNRRVMYYFQPNSLGGIFAYGNLEHIYVAVFNVKILMYHFNFCMY